MKQRQSFKPFQTKADIELYNETFMSYQLNSSTSKLNNSKSPSKKWKVFVNASFYVSNESVRNALRFSYISDRDLRQVK